MFRKHTNTVNQNVVQIWGNKESMNLNSMILTNIQTSNYYKQKLSELKTYHELIDEIYYRVTHLEPWEKGSRRTHGLTGMCGGVRGVGGGGIVSTCFCLLYKLYTLKLSRKQLIGLMTHADSPYIRALGFLYVRYTQDPKDLMWWFGDYLDDEEEIDVKAGGGNVMQIGNMLRQWLTRLEWYDTLFPRIPVPIQNEILHDLRSRYGGDRVAAAAPIENSAVRSRERSRSPRYNRSRSRERSRERSRSPRYRSRSRSRSLKQQKSSRDERSKRDRSSSGSESDRSGVSNGDKKESIRRHHKHHHKKSSSHKRDERETSQERRERRHRHHHKKSGHRRDREDSSDKERRHKDTHKEKEKGSRSPEKRRREKSSDSQKNKKDSKLEYLKKYRDESE